MFKNHFATIMLVTAILASVVAACGGGTPTPTTEDSRTPGATNTAGAIAPSVRSKAIVVRVVDGDTVELEGGQLVRYIGIDGPEFSPYKEDFFGREAYEHNKQLVEGKEVELERDVSDTDSYGRLLRYVFVGGLFVNAEMVSQGYAKAKPSSTDLKYQEMFQGLEREAQQAKIGLWAEQPSASATEGTETPEASPPPTVTPETTATPTETEEATETPTGTPSATSTVTSTETVTATETTTATPTPGDAAGTEVRIAALDKAQEVLTLVNIGTAAVDLQGWSILSVTTGVRYTLPSVVLQPGAQVNIWTQGSGSSATDIHMGLGQAIWTGNARAELYSPSGMLIDAYQ